MGFECVYHYHERVDGEYNKEETKTFKKKVGDPLDDVPLEKLAVAIMAQLARRDMWIVDVDVFEISKKEISFKEAKGGIVLKNKKFVFDGKVSEIITVVEEEAQPQPQPQYSVAPYQAPQPHQQQSLSAAASPVQPHNMIHRPQRRAVDVVVYSPEPQQMFEAQKRGLKLTVDKRYEVFEKRPAPTGLGEIFVIQDDVGKDQAVSDAYFVPGNINLFGDKELGFSESTRNRESANLLYTSNSPNDSMPNLRGKR